MVYAVKMPMVYFPTSDPSGLERMQIPISISDSSFHQSGGSSGVMESLSSSSSSLLSLPDSLSVVECVPSSAGLHGPFLSCQREGARGPCTHACLHLHGAGVRRCLHSSPSHAFGCCHHWAHRHSTEKWTGRISRVLRRKPSKRLTVEAERYSIRAAQFAPLASKGQVWIRHLAPAAPAFTRPSLPFQFQSVQVL